MPASSALIDHSMFPGHPAFMAYITGPGTVPGAAADLLAAGINQNLGGWRLSPAGTEIELSLGRWFAERFGLPRDTAGGYMVSGGVMANFVGLKLARDHAVGLDVRAYALAALFMLWAALALVDLGAGGFAEPGWRPRAAFALAASLALVTHYGTALFLAGCCVAAVVPVVDEIKGRMPVVYVSLKPGTKAKDVPQELISVIETMIGKIARPKSVHVVPDLPKTRSGKIMRRVLAAISNTMDVGDVTTLANPEIVEQIRKQVQGDAPVAMEQGPEDIKRFGEQE